MLRCRDTHLTILFGHPFSPHAHSLDALWIQTTYLAIASYRDHVARAEAAAAPSAPSVPTGGGGGGAAKQRAQRNVPAEQELKKVLTRFRQFLSSEEAWYRQLIARINRFFALDALVRLALSLVGIQLGDRHGDAHGGEDEDGHGQVPDLRPEDKREKLALVHKALICLGDVERYKEQYSPAQRERRRPTGADAEDEERYGRARAYYDAARGVLPNEGKSESLWGCG